MSQFDELPDTWEIASIEDIASYVQRGRQPKYVEYSALPVVNQKCVRWHTIQSEHLKFVHPDQWEKWQEERFLKIGDILWNSTGTGTVGRAAIFQGILKFERVVADSHVTIVRLLEGEPKYLHYWIMSPTVQNKIESMHNGSTNQVELSRAEVLNTQIPLPPLDEQRRIVKKIEALKSRSRKARAALDEIPALLDRFRQSVLAAAFRGDLTADWRKQNPDVKPDSELLDKTQLHSAKQKRIKVGSGIDNPFNLPESWIWVRLFDICQSITDGDHLPPPKANNGIPFLTISNITSGRLDFNQTRYVPEDYYNKIDESRTPRKGDILYTVVGATYGTPVLVDTDTKFCFQRHIAILKPSFLVDRNYLLYGLKSDLVYGQATNATTGTAQPTVTLSGLRPIKIPFPPILEQEEIARRITRFFKTADQIEQFYESNRSDVEKLDQSILAKAFRGELVPQDPNDEPAAVLLDRIRAERERLGSGKKRGKAKA